MTQLQHGLKNAAANFQQVFEEILKRSTGCVAYQDDIFLYGVTDAQLRQR